MPVESALAEGFRVSDDPALLDIDQIHEYLSTQAYWARGRDRAITVAAIAGSHCFGVHGPAGQVGFARVVTDHALFAWVSDVFVLPVWRGRGFGHALIHAIVTHPRLAGLSRVMLVTNDAHSLYRSHGFTQLDAPHRYMVRMLAALSS